MKTYEKVVGELSALRDEKFRVFNERIVNVPSGSSLGVRTPLLRAYAKELVRADDFDFEQVLAFPNDLYEIRLLKCLCAGMARVPFDERICRIRSVVPIIDGWAVCDLFCSVLKEVRRHRGEYLSELRFFYAQNTEFSRRFVYVLLLGCYMTEEYLPQIFLFLEGVNAERYYEHMGAAWLLAEVLTHFWDAGVRCLQSGSVPTETKRMAVRKACESYRIPQEKKFFLKLLKFS